MSIIIRLQNLPLTAKAADIREFFGDLKIPKGSVNIVGGPQGDAFIGFASDEDARIAMCFEGKALHNSKIRLLLSSRREMESVITNAHAMAASVLSGGAKPSASVVTNNSNSEITSAQSMQLTKESPLVVPVQQPLPQQMSPMKPLNEFMNVNSSWLSNFNVEAKLQNASKIAPEPAKENTFTEQGNYHLFQPREDAQNFKNFQQHHQAHQGGPPPKFLSQQHQPSSQNFLPQQHQPLPQNFLPQQQQPPVFQQQRSQQQLPTSSGSFAASSQQSQSSTATIGESWKSGIYSNRTNKSDDGEFGSNQQHYNNNSVQSHQQNVPKFDQPLLPPQINTMKFAQQKPQQNYEFFTLPPSSVPRSLPQQHQTYQHQQNHRQQSIQNFDAPQNVTFREHSYEQLFESSPMKASDNFSPPSNRNQGNNARPLFPQGQAMVPIHTPNQPGESGSSAAFSLPKSAATTALLMDPGIRQVLAGIPNISNSSPSISATQMNPAPMKSTTVGVSGNDKKVPEGFGSGIGMPSLEYCPPAPSTSSYNQNHGPLKATNIPDQNIFNIRKSLDANEKPASSSLSSNVSSSKIEPRQTIPVSDESEKLYVELTRITAELLRPASLEKFLAPSIPLTLSSVKIICDQEDHPQYALVKFGCVEDVKRILERNGEKGIRIRSSTKRDFDNATDGIASSRTAENSGSNNRKDKKSRNVRKRGTRRSRSRSKSVDVRSDESKRRRTRSLSRSPRREGSGPLRICVRLSNVPYRASYKDVEAYVNDSRANFERLQQVFREKHDFSDTWIVEVSTNRDLRCLKRYRGSIFRRAIDWELISVKDAETAYAVPAAPPIRRQREDSDTSTAVVSAPSRVTEKITSFNATSNNGKAPVPLNSFTSGQYQQQQQQNTQQLKGLFSTVPNVQIFTEMPQQSHGKQNHEINESQRQSSARSFQNQNRGGMSRADTTNFSNLQPPKITLEAKTEEELITRGDLPPAAFGAFSNTPLSSSSMMPRPDTFYRPPFGVPNFQGPGNFPRRQSFLPHPSFFTNSPGSFGGPQYGHRMPRPPHRPMSNATPFMRSPFPNFQGHQQQQQQASDFISNNEAQQQRQSNSDASNIGINQQNQQGAEMFATESKSASNKSGENGNNVGSAGDSISNSNGVVDMERSDGNISNKCDEDGGRVADVSNNNDGAGANHNNNGTQENADSVERWNI